MTLKENNTKTYSWRHFMSETNLLDVCLIFFNATNVCIT